MEILRYLVSMNTTVYAAVTAMFFRTVAPALVPVGQGNYGVASAVNFSDGMNGKVNTLLRKYDNY